MKEKLKELPFGIIFGISLIACFYLTVAFVALYIVLNGVEAQTGGSITIFEHWYQILIFIFVIIFFITLILSLIFYFKNKKPKIKNDKILPKLFKRSPLVLFASFFAIMLAVSYIGGDLMLKHEAAINGVLGTNPYERIEDKDNSIVINDYKSDFLNNDGSLNDQKMRENSQEVALQAAVEGTVLLWNNEKALPLKENERVSLFGIAQANYAYLGEGSGQMSVSPKENLRSAFQNVGLKFNTDLFMHYASLLSTHKRDSRRAVNEVSWEEISDKVNTTVQNNDVAIMTISRVAGEHYDILPTNKDNFVDSNNYLDLSTTEKNVLDHLGDLKKNGKIKKIVLLINSSNALQFKNISKLDYIDSCLWVGMGGTMSFNQIANVLSNKGDYVLSGHLPDTFVYDNKVAPSYQNFGDMTWRNYSNELPDLNNQGKEVYASFNIKYMIYQEGIYVGYKYYETRYEDSILSPNSNASSNIGSRNNTNWNYNDEVAFPFGYGISYTKFEYSNYNIEEKDNHYLVKVDVKNIGEEIGKDAVQVYLQKPYTQYDKEHNIEKSSVELVGFAKTKKLNPNESTTIEINVPKEELKTYDSYSKGTYILEKGDYYLTIGEDSHKAINNILTYKGKNISNGMTENGDKNFVHKITIDKDDYEIYSKSLVTNNEIKNQFNDTDLNLYEGSKDQHIKYLSRSNWKDTFPNKVILDCINPIMVKDMQYGEEVIANKEDKMPIYETVTSTQGALTLAMLKDLDFDNPLWEDLLNQMSKEEQEYLMSYGLHHIAGAESISAPGLKSIDGPAGIKFANTNIGTTMSFPGEVLLAATFDQDLVKKVGIAFGNEILHVGYTGIYAPGGCIHRSPYSGRNWEYFSEDGFLSGKMLASEVEGLQSKGAIVFTKHFALNDQETNRYGVATFANEQSIREIYLKAFEIAVREGKMNGVMSSFNRIGTTWAGAHAGLLTNVLRDEWNFNGIVETDSCTGTTDSVHHMTNIHVKAEGLLAGNDLWMDGGGSTTYLKEYENNPTVMLALRRACHRILYIQLHSNAMNGISTSTRIVRVQTWWEKAISTTRYLMIAAFTTTLLLTLFAFFINSKIGNKIMYISSNTTSGSNNLNDNNLSNGNNNPKKPKLSKLGIILIGLLVASISAAIIVPINLNNGNNNQDSSISSSLPNNSSSSSSNSSEPTIHICTQKCPICNGCLDLDCTQEACLVKCGEGKTSYIFEAEEAQLTKGKDDLKIATNNNTTYVGGLNNNMGASLTFEINVEKETTSSLIVSVSKRKKELLFTDMMLVSVNNEELESKAIVKSTGLDKDTWYDFVDVILGCVKLKAGSNIIKFSQLSSGDISGFNFDKIKLLSNEKLTKIITCTDLCPICGKCLDESCSLNEHNDKCHVDGDSYIFEAEEATFISGNKGLPKAGEHNNKYPNDQYVLVGNLSENLNAGISFDFYANENTRVNLIAATTNRYSNIIFTDSFEVKINGEIITRSSYIKPASNDSLTIDKNGTDWWKSNEVNLGCIDLLKGKNNITFTVKTTDSQKLVNFDYIKITSPELINKNEIITASLESISVTTNPTKMNYEEGEKFDPSNMVITANYSDNSTRIVNDYTYSPNGELKIGDRILITYQDKTTYLDIIISKKTSNIYRYETESSAKLTSGKNGNIKIDNAGYIGNLNGNKDASFEFNINAENSGEAELYLALNKRSVDINFDDAFITYLNDEQINFMTTINKNETQSWYSFKENILGTISLINGNNSLKFVMKTNEDIGFNVDYLKIKTKINLLNNEGCTHKCTICNKCIDKNCDSTSCLEKCLQNGTKYTFGSDKATLTNGTKSFKIEKNNAIGNVDENKGGKITFKVNAENDCVASLFVNISYRENSILFTDGISIVINGTEYNSKAIRPTYTSKSVEWTEFNDLLLGCINLNKGENTIEFIVKTNITRNASNFMAMDLISQEKLS